MEFFALEELRRKSYSGRSRSSVAAEVLSEQARAGPLRGSYDIFLSHSFADAEVILGLKVAIEQMNYSVYVDWAEDQHRDRKNVTRETAEILRRRMKSCHSLFFATSESSPSSKWMPWELGYFDGLKGKSAIVPLKETNDAKNIFSGQEYLALYPHVVREASTGKLGSTLFICGGHGKCVRFNDWLRCEADDGELDPIGRLEALKMRLRQLPPSTQPGVVIAYAVRADGSLEYF